MPTVDAHTADATITADRDETKHLVAASRAREVAAALTRRLPCHRHRGPGASTLPAARHFVTTIYFDTPARDLYLAAGTATSPIKLRAKEYYDVHPSLAEVATDPRQLVRDQPLVLLEVKRKRGARTTKCRTGIPRREVPALLRAQHAHSHTGERLVDTELVVELAALRAGLDQPLEADCLVNYRRLAWQDDSGTVRITLDVGVAFFPPPPDLFARSHALMRESLGPPARLEPDAILEVKTRGQPPAWLDELLAAAGARPSAYSKFREASRAIHG